MNQSAKKEARLILGSMLLGLIIGLVLNFLHLNNYGSYLQPIGTAFIKLLKMVIVPLVFSSIYMSIVNLGTPEALGSMGKRAMIYYFLTTSFAVFLGLIFVNIIQPGVGTNLGSISSLTPEMAHKISQTNGLMHTILGVLIGAIPSNPFKSLAETKILQIIVFAILFGIVALHKSKQAMSFTNVMKSLEYMSLHLTHMIMKLAPVGLLALMVNVIAKSGFTAIISLSKYIITVLLGLAFHSVFLALLGSFYLKKSPWYIIKNLSAPLTTAFSTSSSAATLPVTMTVVEEQLGVNKETAKFVLPLGATVNMDGTALYESIAAIFIAQAYNIHLSLAQQIIIFMTASLAAVGAAAIPGAGLITMSLVLSAVGLPLEGIGLILAVDRILDMFRTTVNVFGDCVGTIYVDYSLKKSKIKNKV